MKILATSPRPNILLFNTELLGTQRAQLWVGAADGPTDNDDARVSQERAVQKAPFGIEALELARNPDFPGYFMADVSGWPAGVYRLAPHGLAGEAAPCGTPLRGVRDGQYSWPNVPRTTLKNLPPEQQRYLYRERNNAGWCWRIEITPERRIVAAGDGEEWVSQG